MIDLIPSSELCWRIEFRMSYSFRYAQLYGQRVKEKRHWSGGQTGIRTLGGMTLAGFQDRCIQPALPSVREKS